jgi:hypothetical protein
MKDDQIYIKMQYGEAVYIDIHEVREIGEAVCRSKADRCLGHQLWIANNSAAWPVRGEWIGWRALWLPSLLGERVSAACYPTINGWKRSRSRRSASRSSAAVQREGWSVAP